MQARILHNSSRKLFEVLYSMYHIPPTEYTLPRSLQVDLQWDIPCASEQRTEPITVVKKNREPWNPLCWPHWPGLLGRSYCNYHYQYQYHLEMLGLGFTRYATRFLIPQVGLWGHLGHICRYHNPIERLLLCMFRRGLQGISASIWGSALRNKLISPCMVRHGSCRLVRLPPHLVD